MKVAIIGAGLVGRILALSCFQRIPDIKIKLFDRAENLQTHLGCGAFSAGMVAPFSEFDINYPELSQLGQESLILWPQLMKILPSPQKIFNQNGTLIVAHHHDATDFQQLEQRITKNFLPTQACLLDHQTLKALEPELNQQKFYQKSLQLPYEANINVPKFYAETTNFFLHSKQFIYQQRNIDNVNLNLPELKNVDYIFDTRGLGAKQYFTNLHGVRGEALLVRAKDVKLQHTIRLIHPRHKIYIVPRGAGLYYIGATIIHGEDNSAISVKSMLDLTSALYTVHPGFLEARILKTFAQSRPTLLKATPTTKRENNIIYLNGFHRHGHLLGPTICHKIINNIINKEHHDKNYA